MNETRQTKIEKRNSEETQTDFPGICHGSSSVNKEEILSKFLRIEADLLALKSHVKYKLSHMMQKLNHLLTVLSIAIFTNPVETCQKI